KRLSQPQLELEAATLSPKLVEFVVANVKEQHDPEFGGLDFDADRPDAPKFPVPSRLHLLQHPAGGKADAQGLEMVDLMLQHMASGGIRDHLGGGFHRYSTDREWLVPHFEKMLYDNAQLAVVYLDAYRRTNRISYREVAEEILAFVTRELTSEAGSFYSALDAETAGVEGQYYVWQPAEIQQVLGPADAALFTRAYGFDDPNPFEHGVVLHRGME
ncbi:MAG: thioredoxin domain-containing protein, partial [Planctomycetaceae bacterium]|nr:thioredoxin domain-containing protein [Planctomycetaceae bacterium]